MSCHSCGTEFGFLTKEVGCQVCGFAFCPKCIKVKGKAKKELLCKNCLENELSDMMKPKRQHSPPLALTRRLAVLEKLKHVEDPDKAIFERLQKLKRESRRDSLPSEEDIAERLAKLKGIEPSTYKAPPIEVYYSRQGSLSTPEKVDELLKQMTMEAQIDSYIGNPEDEIAERLTRLRWGNEGAFGLKYPKNRFHRKPKKPKTKQPSEEMDIEETNRAKKRQLKSMFERHNMLDDKYSLTFNPFKHHGTMMSLGDKKALNSGGSYEDDEEEANKLVEKLLATSIDVEELDSLDDTEESNSKSEKESTEEFPWCVICTEDAKIRCFDCESDIYCLRCFRESHKAGEYKDHKTCPYLPGKESAM